MNQFVAQNKNGVRTIFQGNINDYSIEEIEDKQIILEENYTTFEICEMFKNMLEKNNRITISNLGFEILQSLRNSDVILTSNEEKEILLNFIINFKKEHNLY